MKLCALLSLCLLACVTEPTTTDPTATDHIATDRQAITLPEATDSIFWIPNKHGANDLWPTGQGIPSAYVLIKRGPAASTGATFLAFVVWNGNFVGKIFRVRVGADGENFRAVVSNTNATRTFGFPDNNAGSAGNGGGGGVPPIPHPNLDGAVHLPTRYLDGVKTAAGAIDAATRDFMALSE